MYRIVTSDLVIADILTNNFRNLPTQDLYLSVDTVLNPVNITLPAISTLGGFLNLKVYIHDAQNNAATNPITITASGADTINDAASVELNDDGAALVINIVDTDAWSGLGSSTGFPVNVEFIDFVPIPPPPYQRGRMWYDSIQETFSGYIDIPDVTLNIGEEFFQRAFNDTGVLIPNVRALYQRPVGAVGGAASIELAQADSVSTSNVIGVSTHDIPDQTIGVITKLGVVRGADTSAFNVGDTLWLSDSVAGGLTNIQPPLSVEVGSVLTVDAVNGEIYVNVGQPTLRSNEVTVRSLEDLPVPVGTSIGLLPNTIYDFVGNVNIGNNTLVMGNNTILRGVSRNLDGITYTGVDMAISAVDVDGSAYEMFIDAPNGAVFEARNTAGNEKTAVHLIRGVVIRGCDTIGEIENIRRFWAIDCLIETTTTNGIICLGAQNEDLILFDCFVRAFTGTLIDLGASVWDVINISRNHLHHSAGNTVLSGLVSSGNLSVPDGFGIIALNNFIGNGTPLNNITRTDLRWKIFPNTGVADAVPLSADYVGGAKLTFIADDEVSIGTAGQISELKDSTQVYDIRFSGVLSVNLTVAGAGGLDAGGEAPDTWYAVYVIADSTGVSPVVGLFSTSAVAPVLPAGYDIFRRVGWVRNDSVSNILNFIQDGVKNARFYVYQENVASRIILAGGTATVFTAVSAASFVPPTSRRLDVVTLLNTDDANDISYLRTTGSGLSNTGWVNKPGQIQVASSLSPIQNVITDANQSIDYIVTAGAELDIFVVSFHDEI